MQREKSNPNTAEAETIRQSSYSLDGNEFVIHDFSLGHMEGGKRVVEDHSIEIRIDLTDVPEAERLAREGYGWNNGLLKGLAKGAELRAQLTTGAMVSLSGKELLAERKRGLPAETKIANQAKKRLSKEQRQELIRDLQASLDE